MLTIPRRATLSATECKPLGSSCVIRQFGQKCGALAGSRIITLSAKDAKYGFGRPIDQAGARTAAVAKHRRLVVLAMAVDEYERLKFLEAAHGSQSTP